MAIVVMLAAALLHAAGRRRSEVRARLLRFRWMFLLVPVAIAVYFGATETLLTRGLSTFRIDLLGHFPAGPGLWTLALAPVALELLVACVSDPSTAIAPARSALEYAGRGRLLAAWLVRAIAVVAIVALALAPYATGLSLQSRSSTATTAYGAYVAAQLIALAGLWWLARDGCAVVRFVPGPCFDQRHGLFSGQHLIEWARVPVLAFAPWLAAAVLAAIDGWGARDARRAIVTCAGVACYLAFVFGWNFDLGYPSDLDLMFSGAGTLVLLTASVLSFREARHGISLRLRVLLLASALLSGVIVVPPLLATQ